MVNKLEFKKALLEAGISQSGLAKAMNKSPNTIGGWLNGTAFPDTRDIVEVCAILEITDPEKKCRIFLGTPSQE